MERNRFVFFASFEEAINLMDDADKLTMYEAIVGYALHGTETVFSSASTKIAWSLIKPVLQKDIALWENGCKGGAPKGNCNAKKTTKNNQETTKPIYDIGNKEIGNKEIGDNENIKERISFDIPKKSRAVSLPIEKRKDIFWEDMNRCISESGLDCDEKFKRSFYGHWTQESTKHKGKMLYEVQSGWGMRHRLEEYYINGKSWNR